MDPKYDESDDEKPAPKKGANVITLDLIRKRSEHNEGVVTTLEELTLHQEELVSIDRVLGSTCRKLKILCVAAAFGSRRRAVARAGARA